MAAGQEDNITLQQEHVRGGRELELRQNVSPGQARKGAEKGPRQWLFHLDFKVVWKEGCMTPTFFSRQTTHSADWKVSTGADGARSAGALGSYSSS